MEPGKGCNGRMIIIYPVTISHDLIPTPTHLQRSTAATSRLVWGRKGLEHDAYIPETVPGPPRDPPRFIVSLFSVENICFQEPVEDALREEGKVADFGVNILRPPSLPTTMLFAWSADHPHGACWLTPPILVPSLIVSEYRCGRLEVVLNDSYHRPNESLRTPSCRPHRGDESVCPPRRLAYQGDL